MVIFLLLLGAFLIPLQMCLPEIQVMHSRPFLLPILVAYGSLRLDLLKGLTVAVGLGFILDMFSAGRMGVSSLSFFLMSLFIYSQAENFRFQALPHILLLVLLSVFLYLMIDYLFFNIQIGSWRWPFRIWLGMACQSVADAILALPLFAIFDLILRWSLRTKRYV